MDFETLFGSEYPHSFLNEIKTVPEWNKNLTKNDTNQRKIKKIEKGTQDITVKKIKCKDWKRQVFRKERKKENRRKEMRKWKKERQDKKKEKI